MTDLSQLIDKLEKATGPESFEGLYAHEVLSAMGLDGNDAELCELVYSALCKGSLDAAIALVGRVLPGWRWGANGDGWAELHELGGKTPRGRFSYRYEAANAKTPALALCTALLKALHAKEQAR